VERRLGNPRSNGVARIEQLSAALLGPRAGREPQLGDLRYQLLTATAGRTGREYNLPKNRKGAFREDRYHATAVKTDGHLIRCLAYIDLNMVRAGVVQHPSEWEFGGYAEIQSPKKRYTIVNHRELVNLLGIKDEVQLLESHRQWVEEILFSGTNKREARWTVSIAVGDQEFVSATKTKLGAKAVGRKVYPNSGAF
jgi:putative transposase